MCSAPRPRAPKPPPPPPAPTPPPPPIPPPVVVNQEGGARNKYAGIIRKTAVQKGAKRLAARGPSQLLIRRPKQ